MYVSNATKEDIWPITSDMQLDKLLKNFNDRGNTLSLKAMHVHRSMILCVKLRSQYSLRRFTFPSIMIIPPGSLSESEELLLAEALINQSVTTTREMFLRECFKSSRLEPSSYIYQLGKLWGFTGESIVLIQINALLELGFTEQVESLFPQIEDKNSLIDILIQSLRKRIGGVLVNMDKIPEFSSVLVAMDAQAMSWGKACGKQPEPLEILDISRGIKPAVNFDLLATRHLVLKMQSFLLTISGYLVFFSPARSYIFIIL